MRKLCPEYSELSMPACVRVLRNVVINLFFVSGEPSPKWNKRPGALPRAARYTRRAVTGHRSFPVRPMWILTPCLKGSVFEALIRTWIIDGMAELSTEISAKLMSRRIIVRAVRDSNFTGSEETKKA